MALNVCKKCGSEKFVKCGFVRGKQRYKCKECRCQFTHSPLRGVNPALKSFGIVLYAFCGVFMSKIARLFNVSPPAVLKWIKAAARGIESIPQENDAEVVMLDEVWHFVNGKKTSFGSDVPLMGSRVSLSDGNWAIVVTGPQKLS